jgi:excisionase family DNA binding protein
MATLSTPLHRVAMDEYVPHPDDDDLVDQAGAAAILSCSQRTLWNLRTRQGLRYVKIGRSVRFFKGDLRRWLHDRAHAGH